MKQLKEVKFIDKVLVEGDTDGLQSELVSGTNIKTVNGQSVLGDKEV